jgi:hypothetical protein
MSVRYIPGSIGWSAACAVQDRIVHVYSVAGAVVAEGHWRTTVPTDHLRYLDAAASPDGQIQAVGVGADNIGYAVSAGGVVESLGPVSGPYGVGIIWGRDGMFWRYVKPNTFMYRINGVSVSMPGRLLGEAYGFAYIEPDGQVRWWIDHLPPRLVNGAPLQNWVERHGLIAGVISGPERVDLCVGANRYQAIPGVAHSIRMARTSSMWAIAAATTLGAALLIVPPFPAVIPPTPPDPPPPDPEPDIMFPEKLKNGANLKDFVSRELKATGLLGKGADEQARRDNAAKAVILIAQKANAIDGREVYGLRSKHRAGWSVLPLKAGGTIGVFSDLLAYKDPFTSADVVTSAESTSAGTGWTNEALVTDNRHRFVAPSEFAIGTSPPPPPPPPTDCREWIDKVAALEQDLDEARIALGELHDDNLELRAEIERLKNQPPPDCRCQLEGPGWAIRLFGISCRPMP